MSKHLHSQEGFFGSINHYDENGYAGYSQPGLFGGLNHYDKDGNFIGYSQEPILGSGLNHYSEDGEYIGSSTPALFGGYVHHGDGIDGYSSSEFFGGRETYFEDDPNDSGDTDS